MPRARAVGAVTGGAGMMAGLDQVPLLPRDTAGGASGGRRTVPTADTGFFVFDAVWVQLGLQPAYYVYDTIMIRILDSVYTRTRPPARPRPTHTH